MNPKTLLLFFSILAGSLTIVAQENSVRWEKSPPKPQYQPEYLDIQDYPNDPYLKNNWIPLPDGSLRQPKTGLIWQTIDDGEERTWKEAIHHCKNLKAHGKSDWRLPNKEELASLPEKKKTNGLYADPILNLSKTSKGYSWYWSSTTNASNTGSAWVVYFNGGSLNYSSKANLYHVRCVRG